MGPGVVQKESNVMLRPHIEYLRDPSDDDKEDAVLVSLVAILSERVTK
jgi:hypothetical protein